ncbi:MAG: Cna B-type domain-containing protein [Eubacterium sp.]|nr:Cna B-type domain-containing protein [Eubacterium sp.]
MKNRSKSSCLWAGFMLALVMMFMLPHSVQAQSNNETDGEGNVCIRLNSSKENVDLSGVRLAIYQLAEGSYYDNQAELLPEYAEQLTGCSMEDMISSSADSSSLLEKWIRESDTAEAVMTVESDSQGEILFDHLEDGIYLICQQNDVQDFEARGYTITVEPYLVQLPYPDENGIMHGSIDCLPKVSLTSTSDEHISIEVEKHWEDDNNKGCFRPDSIQVTLCNNDQEVETVTLNAAGNWRYVWENLSNEGLWSVKETEVPPGYESKVTSEGNTFIITNHLIPNEEYGNFNPDTGSKEATTSSRNKTGETTSQKSTTGTAKEGEKGSNTLSKSIRSIVKTGDASQLLLFAAVFILSACVIVLVLKRIRT